MAEATIYDVAKRAGVAISTVSKVLSGRHAVSEKTKKRVLKAVRELSYVPSSAARTLAGEPSNFLGVVLTADIPHLTALLHGVDVEVRRREGALIVIAAQTVNERAQAILRLVRGQRVVGVLLVEPHPDMLNLLNELDTRYQIIDAGFALDAAEQLGRQAGRALFGG